MYGYKFKKSLGADFHKVVDVSDSRNLRNIIKNELNIDDKDIELIRDGFILNIEFRPEQGRVSNIGKKFKPCVQKHLTKYGIETNQLFEEFAHKDAVKQEK